MEVSRNDKLVEQYNIRSKSFDQAVRWVTDKSLINIHVKLAGILRGKALELCCGTGATSRALKEAGWDAYGIDISPGMVEEASKHIRARVGDVTRLPYPDRTFDLITMRQAYFLLSDGSSTLKEVRRVLKPSGRFILSQTVPFSVSDSKHLSAIHAARGSNSKFFTTEALIEELQRHAFDVVKKTFVIVRESVSAWLDHAPDLSVESRQMLADMVVNAPESYRKQRNVEVRNGEILEDWNFVVLLAQPRPS